MVENNTEILTKRPIKEVLRAMDVDQQEKFPASQKNSIKVAISDIGLMEDDTKKFKVTTLNRITTVIRIA